MRNNENNLKMTFKDYYKSLSEADKLALRDSFLAESGICYTTFYSKLHRGNFNRLERRVLEGLTDIHFVWAE